MFEDCLVPNDGTVEADGTIVAPDGAVVTGTCHSPCTQDEYTLTCLGSSSLVGAIPAPDTSLGCSAIPVPTPSNVLFYCCPCNKQAILPMRALGSPAQNATSRATSPVTPTR